MIKYEIIKEYDEKQFLKITGVKRPTFKKMVEILKKSTEGEEENRS